MLIIIITQLLNPGKELIKPFKTDKTKWL